MTVEYPCAAYFLMIDCTRITCGHVASQTFAPVLFYFLPTGGRNAVRPYNHRTLRKFRLSLNYLNSPFFQVFKHLWIMDKGPIRINPAVFIFSFAASRRMSIARRTPMQNPAVLATFTLNFATPHKLFKMNPHPNSTTLSYPKKTVLKHPLFATTCQAGF